MRYFALRLLGMAGTLLVISFLTYAVFYLLPADPATLSCGKPCTPARLAEASAFMGYDRSWWQQYLDFLTGIVAGRHFGSGLAAVDCTAPCFGFSFRLNAPVTELILDRAPVTFSIAIGAAVLWLLIGVSAGVAAAVKRGTLVDRSAMLLSTVGVSAPSYLVGLLGILLFGFTLDMVPVGGYVPLTESPVDWLWHLVLPWTVLALRNVLIPVVTVFGLDLGTLLGGAVITERVFSMQGLGALLIDAVNTVDLPLIVGVTLFSAVLVIVANFAVDLVYSVLDPRTKGRM